MKIIDHIRNVTVLCRDDVYNKITQERNSDFVCNHSITSHIDCSCNNNMVEYTYYFNDHTFGYVNVMVFKDGRVWVLYNAKGRIGEGVHCIFNIEDTEEELFMQETLRDGCGVTIDEIKLFKEVWEMYF